MTLNAANSLVKTLEEPPQGSLLILVTAQPGSLPATVRSRCQRLAFRSPAPSAATTWLEERTGAPFDAAVLEYAAGAPLAALTSAEPFRDLDERMRRSLADLTAGRADVASIAAAWTKDSLEARLAWLEYWLSRQIRARFSGSADRVTQSAGPEPLPTAGTALNITALYGLLDRVRELRRTLARTALQKELAVETLLSELLRISSSAGQPLSGRGG